MLPALLLAACAAPGPNAAAPATPAAPAAPDAPEAPTPGPLRPHVEVPFTDGPALADPLLATALDHHLGRLVQLPVSVQLDEHRLGIERARLDTGGPGIQLQLDDSALGVSLLDHLRRACPEAAQTCQVWLEGRWEEGPVPAPPRHPFRVLRFVGPAEGATHVRVEAASP